MKDVETNLEYRVEPGSLIDRLIAWKEGMSVIDFVVPTNNSYIHNPARYTAFYKGDLNGAENVLMRIQSACLLGRVWDFDDCDCQSQILRSYDLLEKEQKGLFVYCNDDHGKGVGLANHAMTLMVEKIKKLDEDSARAYLGLKDSRDYKPIVVVINHFGIRSIRILTDDPSKFNVFEQYSLPYEQVRLAI